MMNTNEENLKKKILLKRNIFFQKALVLFLGDYFGMLMLNVEPDEAIDNWIGQDWLEFIRIGYDWFISYQ